MTNIEALIEDGGDITIGSESVRAFVPAGRVFATLGTDGFGRSDRRTAPGAFFGVDAAAITLRALAALHAA